MASCGITNSFPQAGHGCSAAILVICYLYSLNQAQFTVTPERALAFAVIRLAVADVKGQNNPPVADRRRAENFLAGSPGLHFWAAVARVDPELIRQERR